MSWEVKHDIHKEEIQLVYFLWEALVTEQMLFLYRRMNLDVFLKEKQKGLHLKTLQVFLFLISSHTYLAANKCYKVMFSQL